MFSLKPMQHLMLLLSFVVSLNAFGQTQLVKSLSKLELTCTVVFSLIGGATGSPSQQDLTLYLNNDGKVIFMPFWSPSLLGWETIPLTESPARYSWNITFPSEKTKPNNEYLTVSGWLNRRSLEFDLTEFDGEFMTTTKGDCSVIDTPPLI